ncbi:MAG: acylase [Bacteroidales bacterium]|nr:acylase [Bacteroidales bacterium]
MKKLLFLLLITTACTPRDGSQKEIQSWEKQARKITIIRDHFGVPHVYGKTDADAVFGLMYAQCEDDFNRVEVNYINAMGRMAEVKGESELFTDLRMHLYIDQAVVKKEYDDSPQWLKKLMDAFADGVNYYLYKHPETKPLLLTRFEPWMALTFSEGSIGGDIERISTRQLGSFYSNEPQLEIEETPPEKEPGGSNGFAIAPKLTESGNAMLLINPHTSFYFRGEVHMVSEEGLNAYGAVTWGQFFVYQGFNDKCGWMHTSSRADAIDYFAETISKKDGKLYYKHGDELKPVIEKKIDLPYKDGDEIAHKEFTVYYTQHGPIIRQENDKWISISLMVEHVKALTQSYTRTKAQGHDDFKKTMDLHTNSSNNTVYADADGNIAYYHGNYIPVRDTRFNWNGIVDGSDPDTDYKGLHSVDEMIFIFNPQNGWIQNCNSTPFTAAGDYSPKREDYAPYMSPDKETPRGLHAVRVLTGQSGFTLDKLIATAYDSYLTYFEDKIPALIKAYDNAKPATQRELAEPISLLKDWDLRYSLSSVPTSLAIYWGQTLRRRSTNDEQMLDALKNAVKKLEDDFGSWKTPWGEINRYQRLNGDIVQHFDDSKPSLPVDFVSSRWGSLASFGARTYPGTVKMYGTSGNSFIAVVEFGDKVKAKSLLAGGNSGDPDNPHFDDQALMYTKGQFKDVRYYREDVEDNAEQTYHPGGEK